MEWIDVARKAAAIGLIAYALYVAMTGGLEE